MSDLYDVVDMAYSEGFSVSVNLIGTIDCDSVKGCIGNCYAGDCYALRTAQRFGWDFHDPKVRKFSDEEIPKFTNQIQAAGKKSGRKFARIGVMGDPSLSWKNTIRVAKLIKDAGLTPVVISKHRRIATDDQFKTLVDLGAILHSSICPLDGPAVKMRYDQALRYRKMGGKALIRLITYKTNNGNDESLMQYFIDHSQVPILETPLRITKGNDYVKSGRVLNPNDPSPRTKRVCGVSDIDCYKCKEQCGMDWTYNDVQDSMYEKVLPLFRELLSQNHDTLLAGETVTETDLEWTTEYINNLPDRAFAVLEPDYLNGKTKDKNARHLPYENREGEVDLPHLRNALARLNQIKPITESITAEEMQKKAESVLAPLAKKYLQTSEHKKDYIRPTAFNLGVTMPSITKEQLMQEFKIPADKAEDLATRLSTIGNDPGPADKPWYEAFAEEPLWTTFLIWNLITDPFWIWRMSVQAKKEGTTMTQLVRNRFNRWRGRQPPSGSVGGPINTGAPNSQGGVIYGPHGQNFAQANPQGTPAGAGLAAGQALTSGGYATLAPYQAAPGSAGVPTYGVPGYGNLSSNTGGGWGFGTPIRQPSSWGASYDETAPIDEEAEIADFGNRLTAYAIQLKMIPEFFGK